MLAYPLFYLCGYLSAYLPSYMSISVFLFICSSLFDYDT